MFNILVSFGRNGTQDWFWQRASAIVLAIYSVFILTFIALNPDLNFDTWYDFFQNLWVKLATVFAVISLIIHAWIGMITIITDYIKPVFLRILAHSFIILSLIVFLIWGIVILWSI